MASQAMIGWRRLVFLLGPCQAAMLNCDAGELAPLAVGDPVFVCVFMSTQPVKKMVFQIKVEESAELVLKGSALLAIGPNDSQPLYTWVSRSHAGPSHPLDCSNSTEMDARGSYLSCPQICARSAMVAQLTNLVVNLRDGEVSSFAWDNTCSGCAPSKCMQSSQSLENFTEGSEFFQQGTCGVGRDVCVGTPAACDLRVFVTWVGHCHSNVPANQHSSGRNGQAGKEPHFGWLSTLKVDRSNHGFPLRDAHGWLFAGFTGSFGCTLTSDSLMPSNREAPHHGMWNQRRASLPNQRTA
ncbi:unnamed protein product [Effrenium voratum]|uniref:Uncharacterized protein n=1 Tax=Effrenium voratum TaxID=2562239 RepID=A0AA36ILA8_9DINO|nr:unnamed protein product [Effrenium voratum]